MTTTSAAAGNGRGSGRDCPCKRVPLCLSSFTAAEHGDLNSLLRRSGSGGLSLASRRDAAGNTPLHLAAQHGNVAATVFLLKSAGCDVNGRVRMTVGDSNYDHNDGTTASSSSCCTPLHRASFSGAVGTMRVLLDNFDCDLVSRDTSFGDLMTPLHKAVSGGRYLAVKLLLDELKRRRRLPGGRNANVLGDALKAKDSLGRTPLQLAMEMRQRNYEEESSSVARWNAVAGGLPDWEKCSEILMSERDDRGMGDEKETRRHPQSSSSVMPKLPWNFDCVDCMDGKDCATASWEAAFQKALFNSVMTNSGDGGASSGAATATQTTALKPQAQQQQEQQQPPETVTELPSVPSPPQRKQQQENSNNSSLGKECYLCHSFSYALFRRGDVLVCKRCSRKKL